MAEDSPVEVPTQNLPMPESRKQKSLNQIKSLPKAKDQKTMLPENGCSTPTTWTPGSKVVTGNSYNPHPTIKHQGHHNCPSQPVSSPLQSLHIKQLTKLVVITWANELKSLDYLLGCGKFNGESQKRLDKILSLLEANRDHLHWTKKLLQENELHAKVYKVWKTAEYCKKSRKEAGKIYTVWRTRHMLDSLV